MNKTFAQRMQYRAARYVSFIIIIMIMIIIMRISISLNPKWLPRAEYI